MPLNKETKNETIQLKSYQIIWGVSKKKPDFKKKMCHWEILAC